MKRRSVYHVEYKLYECSEVKGIDVIANNKEDAYSEAVFTEIPKNEGGQYPYSAWTASVTYNNGNYKRFNTFEGKPY